ncbi:vezatin-like [Lingula anatina]|uniref:Vezatin-like n=1 Tax=Lingula anatina TaxID=7574 RepID=A0A1S3IQ58_LINAN|nr:vezatin-like [Lingula anatina]|eukprot:XP_013400355.1 vezatin-like [Lingula anatina]
MDSIIIEDQVFEAYTDPSEVEDSDFGHELLLSAEEKAKRKREKQEAVRLLNELKSVIGIRAKKWEERERKLMKKIHAGKVPNKEEDESEETKSEVAVCAGSENDLSGSEKSAAIKSDELENGLSCDIVQKNYASDTKQTHAETDISLEVESETEQEKGENNKINNLCQRVYRPDSTRNNSDLTIDSAARRNPQDRLDSGSFSFAANIAAMAAARSRQQVQLSVQTYQDSDDSDDGDCIVDD